MPAWENLAVFRPRALGKIWLAWLATAAFLLLLFSFALSRTATSEKALGYAGSVLSFAAACAAGVQSAKGRKGPPLVCGLLCAVSLVLPLLLCGVLIDRSSLSADSVMSLVSFSLAGALFGSVFLSGRAKKKRRRHAGLDPKGSKRRH